ncbi:hypothetical protein Lal_00027779 [Lupinus albus]|uniref:Uncharacterized protein n=1 Tax=Lupinus albus TaxID=3870 RepID=A0A6A5MFN6_LUPAL|nr:hypothetical protein Lalb_Chr05g0215091 [Lupinus albus]KAF1873741.1 hypothetical protein Lal_00027779 [Lupinus albus]
MAEAAPTKPINEEFSSSELLSSAKLVAEAAQAGLRNESDKVDKVKVADAAGDLLEAAEKYAKLDDQKGVGQYVDKAADYLHQYSGGSTTSPPNTAAAAAVAATDHPSEADPPKPESKSEESGGGGGGFGQFTKLAGNLFSK